MGKRKIEQLLRSHGEVARIDSMESIEGTDAVFVTYFSGEDKRVAIYNPDTDTLFVTFVTPHIEDLTITGVENARWETADGEEALVVDGIPQTYISMRDRARREFAKRVRTLREEAGISQECLGHRCGILRQNVVKIESGRYGVTLDTMTRLRAVLPTL